MTELTLMHLGKSTRLGYHKSGVFNKDGMYCSNNGLINEGGDSPIPLRDLTVLPLYGQQAQIKYKLGAKGFSSQIKPSNEIMILCTEVLEMNVSFISTALYTRSWLPDARID